MRISNTRWIEAQRNADRIYVLNAILRHPVSRIVRINIEVASIRCKIIRPPSRRGKLPGASILPDIGSVPRRYPRYLKIRPKPPRLSRLLHRDARSRGELRLERHTAICTIYNGNLDPPEAHLVRMVLMMFNDVILRCGFERHLPIIDLRLVCSEATDYANPIEPSGSGGLKIAKAIAGLLGVDEPTPSSRVYIQ